MPLSVRLGPWVPRASLTICSDANADAALLIHAHGGPAVGFVERRSIAADNTRYPYRWGSIYFPTTPVELIGLRRYLLKAGYRVFLPLFRGTLGFGDKFAQVRVP